MTGWLIYDKEGAKRNSWFIDQIILYAKKQHIEISLKLIEDLTLMMQKSILKARDGENSRPDFVINRTVFPFVSQFFESMKITVFNCAKVSQICNDKRKTHMYLAGKNIEMMDTYFYDRRFWDGKTIAKYPCVVKPANGHGGKGVYIVKNEDELKKSVSSYDVNEFLVQKIADVRGKDLRVYVLANKIVGAVMRSSSCDFRSNFSLGGNVEAYCLNEKEKEVVENVAKNFDFSYVGIDFVFDEGRMKLNEIEDVVGARMLYKTHSVAVHEMYVDYIISKISGEIK